MTASVLLGSLLGPLPAALLVGSAVLLVLRRRPEPAAVGPEDGPAVPRSRRRTLLAVVLVAGTASVALHGPVLLLTLVTVGVTLGAADLLRRQRARAAAETAALRATEFCEALAADLLAGGGPGQALEAAATDFSEFASACAAERLGADVSDALRRLSRRPGLGDLRLVAGAWHVSYRSGAGLAESLDRVARTLRARRRTGRLVAAELASAYATARIMAALPLVFVLVGSGMGADPLGFLTGSTPGALCLAAGLLLTWAGLAWLQRIGDTVSVG